MKLVEAYKIAIDTRNFEIRLFWQRSLFFAGFVSVIFFGYSDAGTETIQKLILSSLGFLLSLAWSLANRGSKYWYESWETKINKIEEELDFKLFDSWEKPQGNNFIYKSRLYSVSKIAIYVTDLIFVGWLVILLKEIVSYFQLAIELSDYAPVLFVIFLLTAVYFLITKTKTNVPQDIKNEWQLK